MVMTKFRIALPVIAAAAGLLVPAGVASAATAAPAHPAATAQVASKSNGCPLGDACMYTVPGWNNGRNGHPEHIYTYDHCFNLSGEIGARVIYNLQRQGEKVKGYTHPNCAGTRKWVVLAGEAEPENITPIFSIRLG
jgi:hypothetical protein